MTGELVLVTGGTGFVGSHCIVALLQQGYRVRTTVRSLGREQQLRSMISSAGVDAGPDHLELAEADLLADAGWDDAMAGCDYLLHVASPFPLGVPKDEDELIRPAREGALRALRAAKKAGVKRAVLTSSFAAIGYGHPHDSRMFTEADWTDLTGTEAVAPYPKSKTLAERAAWDYVAGEGAGLELSVVNPVAIFGPPLGSDTGTSLELLRRMLDGKVPGLPRLAFGIIDVRDVADLHMRAMTHPEAAGERFLAISGDFMSMKAMAEVLRSALGERARKVPTRQLPDWLVRLVGRFDSGVGQLATEIGADKHATSQKAQDLLGWSPRPPEEALVSSAESLLALG